MVGHVWAAPTRGSDTEVYVPLLNTAPAADQLVSIIAPTAKLAELVDGSSRRIGAIELPPNRPVVLKPGGFRIRLIGLDKPLRVGDRIKLTLVLPRPARSLSRLMSRSDRLTVEQPRPSSLECDEKRGEATAVDHETAARRAGLAEAPSWPRPGPARLELGQSPPLSPLHRHRARPGCRRRQNLRLRGRQCLDRRRVARPCPAAQRRRPLHADPSFLDHQPHGPRRRPGRGRHPHRVRPADRRRHRLRLDAGELTFP